MFGLGLPELVVILVIAVLIFGPKRLPELGQNVGKAIREFKKSTEELKNDVANSTGLDEKSRQELKDALNMEDVRKNIEGVGKDLQEAVTLEEPKSEAGREEVQRKKKLNLSAHCFNCRQVRQRQDNAD